ncbi:hypothetical protein KY315_03590, partial [Candidatus Woesearchaeota archaeon]|nr:hypothetical protein [Candidatus Woesearchaeota archaeon]
MARKESAKRASQISSMADTLSKIQRQANEKHKANQIVLKEQLGTARGMEKVLSSVDTTIRNIAKASANLAQLSKTVTFETARGVKKITVGGIKSIQESASQYTKAISEDINWNKQNMMIGAMGRVSPIVGYFVAKMFNTTVMQNMVYKLKEKLNLALSSVSNRFKQIAGQGWEKTKEIFSGMANKVFKKGVVRTKVVSEKERDKKEKKTLVEKAKEAKVIPHLQEGGFVSKEGVVKVHAGEVVQPVEKVVEQIVDQVNKRMDKQQGSEDVYQKHEAMARAKFFDAKTAEVRANITDKEKGDRKFGRLTKIMENLQAAFGIVKSEQILTSKENRKRRSIMGTFINRYLGEVREYDRPIQWRQWKLLLDIKQGILSQKRFIGLSIEGLQAAWQQTLHEHPVFAGVYLFAKSLTKVLASPFKLLLGSLGGGSKYRKDMPSGGNNIFESLLEATSTTYVGQMHRLDQLIEYNKHILEASRDTASSVGGITSSEEVQDRMEQAKRRSIAGYGVQGLAALPSRYAARGAKQSGIVGAAGMGGIGAIYGGLLGGPLGMLLGGAGGAAVGGLGGAIGKYTKDKFTDWRKKKAEEKKKAAEAKKPKVTLISTVQDLTEAELQMVDKLENLVSEIKRGSYRGSQITSGRADDIEQQRMQMAVGQSFSMEDLTDKGDKGLSKRIELREYINRKKQKKAETDEIRKNMVGYQKQQQELKEAQQRAQEMYLTSTFAGKKEALAKKIGAAFDPIAPIKAKLEARASRKEEKKKAKELENEARRMQIREKRDAQKASAAELVKLKRKTIEGMAPGKQRDLILSKIEKTLDKSKNIQRKLYFQENKVGKGLLERAKLTGRFMKKQWRATLTNNKISGKIARRIKGFGGSVWKFLLMAGPMIMGFIKPIFAPFTPLLKIIPMFAKSISSLGPVLASIGKLVAGGAAGLGKFIAPLLGPGLALVSAGAAGAAIGTILNKFVGPKIQGVFDKWQDKGKKESAKSFEGTKKALKTATTSTNIDKVAEAKALLDYKGSLTKAGGVFGGKRTSDYGLLTSKL